MELDLIPSVNNVSIKDDRQHVKAFETEKGFYGFYCFKNVPNGEYEQHEVECDEEFSILKEKLNSTEKNYNAEGFTQPVGYCVFCQKSFPELMRHLNTEHISEVLKSFGSFVSLKRLRTREEKKDNDLDRFTCKFCKKTIGNPIRKHEQLCEIIWKYRDAEKCLICHTKLRTNAREHYRTKHLELFDERGKHILLGKPKNITNDCQIDKFQTNQKEKRIIKVPKKYHMFDVEADEKNDSTDLKCKFCDRSSFKALHFKKIHERQCGRYRKYVNGKRCLICNKTLTHSKNVPRHLKLVHNVDPDQGKENRLENIHGKTFESTKLNQEESETSQNSHFESQIENVAIDIDGDDTESDFEITSDIDIEEFNIEHLSENNFPIVPVVKKQETVLVKHNKPLIQSNPIEVIDVRMVHKLYKCPICLGKFVVQAHVQDHIIRFHRISMENIVRMRLKIEEITVTNL